MSATEGIRTVEVVTRGGLAEDPVFTEVSDAVAERLYRDVVVGRGINLEADALSKQGALAVYASSLGQEACEVACVAALEAPDMLFPTYRDTVAAVMRGVSAEDVLALFAGSWHSGFGPEDTMVMPLSTPIATQTLHAVGWAMGRRMDGAPAVAMALIGDGGTSEGDFAEALNFAGVYDAPVVFFVQNNGWAISVPVDRQSSAPTLAHKAVAAGMPGIRCDGQDVLAVQSALAWAVDHARSGQGPVLVEAMTYRFGPHTNNDDPTRYRDDDRDVGPWRERDPLTVVEQRLRERDLWTDELIADADERARRVRAAMRAALFDTPATPDPMELFDHVYVDGTGHHERQRAQLRAELDAGGTA
jgi:2-oxoisovalerate dehydrogenase E1 component alpha subunit